MGGVVGLESAETSCSLTVPRKILLVGVAFLLTVVSLVAYRTYNQPACDPRPAVVQQAVDQVGMDWVALSGAQLVPFDAELRGNVAGDYPRVICEKQTYHWPPSDGDEPTFDFAVFHRHPSSELADEGFEDLYVADLGPLIGEGHRQLAPGARRSGHLIPGTCLVVGMRWTDEVLDPSERHDLALIVGSEVAGLVC